MTSLLQTPRPGTAMTPEAGSEADSAGEIEDPLTAPSFERGGWNGEAKLKTRRIAPKFGRLANVTTTASVDVSPPANLAIAVAKSYSDKTHWLATPSIIRLPVHPTTRRRSLLCQHRYVRRTLAKVELPGHNETYSRLTCGMTDAFVPAPLRRGGHFTFSKLLHSIRLGDLTQRSALSSGSANDPYPSATTVTSKATLPGTATTGSR
ncbi:hypothetical protein HPB51_027438 [Rhipicephalus microplus]|uniref:Uncharacterized protein n=1 Tax=Rhipicephalus microplus TaxID=6941 RepID=A0A9J6D088_RHIMP|nr:hypothetical protein HPB51_027438 [Rhipicephalus microplus]